VFNPLVLNPPTCRVCSSNSTRAPARDAATDAVMPAGVPPYTTTSYAICCRAPSGHSPLPPARSTGRIARQQKKQGACQDPPGSNRPADHISRSLLNPATLHARWRGAGRGRRAQGALMGGASAMRASGWSAPQRSGSSSGSRLCGKVVPLTFSRTSRA
jgi:hypothetical protein